MPNGYNKKREVPLMPPTPPMPQTPQPPLEIGFEPERTVSDYLNMFLKRKEIIFTFFLISVILSAIYYYKMPNVYQATSQILIGKEESGLVTAPEVAAAGTDSSRCGYTNFMQTQFFIITSRPVIQTLADQLELVKKYDYFASGDAVSKLQKMINVSSLRNTQVVNLSVAFTDPKLCVEIANALTDIYIRQNIATKLYFSNEVLKWFPKESETIKMQTVYGQLQELSKKDVIDSLPSVARDPIIRELKQRKAELETELHSLTLKYKEKYPVIVKLKEDLKYTDDRLEEETQKIVDNLRAELAGKLQLTNIRIMQYATLPTYPIGPKRMQGILRVGLIGVLMGLGLVYMLDYLDNTIRSQEDVEKHIRLPYLGHIPAVKDKTKDEYERRIIVHAQPESQIAEAFKNIRTGIIFSAPPETLKSILITSTIPSEGKTFVSVNLAATIALDGNKVLLVDSDMRRPTIHNTFKLDNSTGLSNYLTGNISLDLIINNTSIENLSFVNAGPTPPNPSGLLGSFKMEEFIKEVETKFDRIIIDGPPLIGVSDGVILSKATGGTLLVIRFGTASRDIIGKAKQGLQDLGTNIIGVVLNDLDIDKEAYYSKYYHYYSRYYSKYGADSSTSEPTEHT